VQEGACIVYLFRATGSRCLPAPAFTNFVPGKPRFIVNFANIVTDVFEGK
jgi:hypothetical protein